MGLATGVQLGELKVQILHNIPKCREQHLSPWHHTCTCTHEASKVCKIMAANRMSFGQCVVGTE
eukprot:6785438-Alexandrium_andersonii.AAC.1